MKPPLERASASAVAGKATTNFFIRNFYVITGVVALLIVVAGFTPTYVIPVSNGSFSAKPIYHVHGILFSLWMILNISQPLLIRFRMTSMHKKIGYAGLALALAMVVTGVIMAFVSTEAAMTAGKGERALRFLIVPLTDMLLFVSFIAIAMFNLRDAALHKRVMLLATLSILPAAFGRIMHAYGVPPTAIMLVQECTLILGIFFDLYTRRKIHSVYIFGGAAIIIIHLVRFPIGRTQTWMEFARWIME